MSSSASVVSAHNTSADYHTVSSSNITVGIRIKPIDSTTTVDAFAEGKAGITAEGSSPAIFYSSDREAEGAGANVRHPQKVTPADFVFGQDSTQEEVYSKSVRDLILSVPDGLNASVIAYGQTGSGLFHYGIIVDFRRTDDAIELSS